MNSTLQNKGLSEHLLLCAHCGMCLSVCPVYRETLIESDSPRARLTLIKAVENGSLDEKAGFIHKIYDCTSCMACAEVCPSGVHPDELILSARAQIKKKPSHLQKFITNQILSYPSRLRGSLLPLHMYERSGIRRLVRRTHLIDLLPERLACLDSMLPELSGIHIYCGKKIVYGGSKNTEHKVGYFPGCAQNLVFISVAQSTINVLEMNQCEVSIPAGLACCGMPHIGYGEREEAKKLARHNIDSFRKVDIEYIVTDCATCGSMLKNFGSLLSDDPEYAEKARLFSEKVRDITEFLVNDIVINRNFRKLSSKVTYHEPCHLRRGQNLKEAPRKMLSDLLGNNFIDMNESDSCCGGAGSYTITHHSLSMKMLDRKMKNLKDSGAGILATACPGCQIQLAQGIEQSNQKVRLMHIVELLSEAYRTNP